MTNNQEQIILPQAGPVDYAKMFDDLADPECYDVLKWSMENHNYPVAVEYPREKWHALRREIRDMLETNNLPHPKLGTFPDEAYMARAIFHREFLTWCEESGIARFQYTISSLATNYRSELHRLAMITCRSGENAKFTVTFAFEKHAQMFTAMLTKCGLLSA